MVQRQAVARLQSEIHLWLPVKGNEGRCMNPNLVFASGVLVPQQIAGLDYFKGLAAIYPEETTLFPPVSVLGSVQSRALELAARIDGKFKTGEVHIIAHSMGGLDARCLLAQN